MNLHPFVLIIFYFNNQNEYLGYCARNLSRVNSKSNNDNIFLEIAVVVVAKLENKFL